MPFDDKYKPVYEDVIIPAVKKIGLEAKRASDIFDVKQSIMVDVWKYINMAKVIIADLSNKNPNVFYEVELIARNIEDVPFDLRHLRCIIYQDSIRGANVLMNTLVQTLEEIL